MVKSVLAVLVAVGLIAGALFVRNDVLDGRSLIGGGGGGAPVAGGGAAPEVPEGEVRVACDAALGDGCPEGATRLDVTAMLAAFEDDAQAFEVVVAPSIVLELIEGSGTTQARFAAERDVLATSPLLLAVAGSRSAAVQEACGAAVTWTCAADLVQEGALTLGLTDPDARTDGLAALAALTGGFLDTATYSTNSLSGSDFFTWLDALGAGSQVSADPVSTLIRFNGSRNDSAVVIEAPGLGTIGRSAQAVPDTHWPEPLASVAVVAVAVAGTEADVRPVAHAAAESLLAVGWRGPDGTPVEDGPPLDPDDDGLPSGGVLFALQDRWN